MKRFVPIIAILVLVGMLALLTRTINKSAGSDEDRPPPPAATKAPAPPALPSAADPLPPEITLGNPATAQDKVTMGWVYDSANQADPTALAQAIDAVKQRAAASGGKVSAEIVNLDVPGDELSPQAQSVTGLGVAINGEAGAMVGDKEIALAGNPGEGSVTAANIGAALDGMPAATQNVPAAKP